MFHYLYTYSKIFISEIIFRVVRHEDVIKSNQEMTDIFDFIGLKNMTTSQDYLPNLNEQEWIMSMPIDEILNIQKAVSIYFFLKNVLVTSNFDSSIIACIS